MIDKLDEKIDKPFLFFENVIRTRILFSLEGFLELKDAFRLSRIFENLIGLRLGALNLLEKLYVFLRAQCPTKQIQVVALNHVHH